MQVLRQQTHKIMKLQILDSHALSNISVFRLVFRAPLNRYLGVLGGFSSVLHTVVSVHVWYTRLSEP